MDKYHHECKHLERRRSMTKEEQLALRRIRDKAWREANKEKISERNKQYREANKEKCYAQSKAWAQANRERVNAKNKAWRDAHPEIIKQSRRDSYHRNKKVIVKDDMTNPFY